MKFGEKLENTEAYEPFKYENQIRLDANESYIFLPEDIKFSVFKELTNIDFNRYPDPYAVKLCKAFADYYEIESKNVLAGNGSDELISIIMGSVLSKNSRVLITAPDFSMYKFYCGTGELDMTLIDKDNKSLNLNIDEIIRIANKNNIDFLILSNPCNPTGIGISRAEIIKLISSCRCTVCIDEAYMDFWSESVINFVDKYENLIVLKTCSKNFGLAALRLGFVIAGEKLLNPIKKAKSPYNLNSLSQAAGTIILKHKDYLKKATIEIIKRKEELYNTLKKLERHDFTLLDTKTNFITIKTTMATDIYNFLLENNIIVRCLGNDLLRITTGSEDENKLLTAAIREAL